MGSPLTSAMTEVLEASVRWLPVFAAALLLTRLMGRAPAAHRHAVWLASVMALAAMPLLNAVLPAHRIDSRLWTGPGEPVMREAVPRPQLEGADVSQAASPSASGHVAASASSNGAGASAAVPPAATSMGMRVWIDLFAWLWAPVTLTLLLREASALRRASRVAAAASADIDGVSAFPQPDGSTVDVRSAAVAVPLACGLMRPTILLPHDWRRWPAGWLDAAVLHESVHVRRRDVLTQFVVRIICSVFWFHPAVWIALRRLRNDAEQAADEAVVNAGFDRHLYAEALLGLAHERGRQHAPAVPMAGKHPLAARLLRIVDAPAEQRGRGLWPAVSSLALLAIVAAVPVRRGITETWLRRSAYEDGAVVWRTTCAPSAHTDLCARFDDAAVRALGASGGGFVAVADVRTGQLRHYIFLDASGTAAPVPAVRVGALMMLPLAVLWWEAGMGDRPQPCPAVINLAGAGAFANGNGLDTGVVRAPLDILRMRCATGAIAMGWYLHAGMGTAALAGAFGRLGFGRDGAPFWARPDLEAAPASHAIGGGYDERSTWILAGSEHGTVRTSPLHLARFLQAAGNRGVARQMVPPGEPPDTRSWSVFSGETADRLLHALVDTGANRTDQAGRLLGLVSGRVEGLHQVQAELFGGVSLNDAGEPELAIVVWLEQRASGEAVPSPEDVAYTLLQDIRQ